MKIFLRWYLLVISMFCASPILSSVASVIEQIGGGIAFGKQYSIALNHDNSVLYAVNQFTDYVGVTHNQVCEN